MNKGCLGLLISFGIIVSVIYINGRIESCNIDKQLEKNRLDNELKLANRTPEEKARDSTNKANQEIDELIDGGKLIVNETVNQPGSLQNQAKKNARTRINNIYYAVTKFDPLLTATSDDQIIDAVQDLDEDKARLLALERFVKWDDTIKIEYNKCLSALRLKMTNNYSAFRKAYIESIKHEYWLNDIRVKCVNKDCSIASFVGGAYLVNRNKQNLINELEDDWSILRFKKILIKAYDLENQYTAITVNSLNDKDF